MEVVERKQPESDLIDMQSQPDLHLPRSPNEVSGRLSPQNKASRGVAETLQLQDIFFLFGTGSKRPIENENHEIYYRQFDESAAPHHKTAAGTTKRKVKTGHVCPATVRSVIQC